MKLLKLILILLVCMLCSGCFYFTARVSEIGVRNIEVKRIDDHNCYAEIYTARCGGHVGINFPYGLLAGYSSDTLLDRMIVQYRNNSIGIELSDDGTVWKLHETVGYYHIPITDTNKTEILQAERKWWGYPSQILQVVALPIDIITGPFVLVYLAVR